jgi:hypothetical protein
LPRIESTTDGHLRHTISESLKPCPSRIIVPYSAA